VFTRRRCRGEQQVGQINDVQSFSLEPQPLGPVMATNKQYKTPDLQLGTEKSAALQV
jgi:hypothetical protein